MSVVVCIRRILIGVAERECSACIFSVKYLLDREVHDSLIEEGYGSVSGDVDLAQRILAVPVGCRAACQTIRTFDSGQYGRIIV